MVYCAEAIKLPTTLTIQPLMSFLSKCVEPHEVGKVFTLFRLAQLLMRLASWPAVKALYGATEDTEPGAQYFFVAALMFLAFVITGALYVSARVHEDKVAPTRPTNDRGVKALAWPRKSTTY